MYPRGTYLNSRSISAAFDVQTRVLLRPQQNDALHQEYIKAHLAVTQIKQRIRDINMQIAALGQEKKALGPERFEALKRYHADRKALHAAGLIEPVALQPDNIEPVDVHQEALEDASVDHEPSGGSSPT
jgi:hypothetical protein